MLTDDTENFCALQEPLSLALWPSLSILIKPALPVAANLCPLVISM